MCIHGDFIFKADKQQSNQPTGRLAEEGGLLLHPERRTGRDSELKDTYRVVTLFDILNKRIEFRMEVIMVVAYSKQKGQRERKDRERRGIRLASPLVEKTWAVCSLCAAFVLACPL